MSREAWQPTDLQSAHDREFQTKGTLKAFADNASAIRATKKFVNANNNK